MADLKATMTHESEANGFPNDPNTNQPIGNAALYSVDIENQIRLISIENPLCVKRILEPKLVSSISDALPVTSMTSIKIADANPLRKFFSVCTDGDNQAVWVKLQAASIDDDKKGIWIEAKIGALNFWQMPTDNIYVGEISAIANSANVNLFTTEY